MLRRLFFPLGVLTLVCPVVPAFAAGLPGCAGPVEIAHAKVVRVERNGLLILSDGRAIKLEGIRLNPAQPGETGTAVAPDVLAVLRDMTAKSPVTFTALRPKEDRYDRVRAQAFVDGTWLQAALLERGLARAAPSPDRGECSAELMQAETRGRGAHAGVWNSGAAQSYRVRGPHELRGTAGTFQVVEGWVTNVGQSSGRVFIDFGNDWRQGFSATIAPQDRAQFRKLDLNRLVARHVRIRGMVQDYRGRPEIALSNPGQIELLN